MRGGEGSDAAKEWVGRGRRRPLTVVEHRGVAGAEPSGAVEVPREAVAVVRAAVVRVVGGAELDALLAREAERGVRLEVPPRAVVLVALVAARRLSGLGSEVGPG